MYWNGCLQVFPIKPFLCRIISIITLAASTPAPKPIANDIISNGGVGVVVVGVVSVVEVVVVVVVVVIVS